ncbi:hypothetical protein [Planctomycetes bacterium K23_9]|uniref:Secreted protein n=1 Tax=Stieleria marina TaxID=1930275 RepID=A0A517NW68_9BACT|nr:hypothetical protein K239x_33640 [Planctomycetes bacterium K23_9]
MNLSLTRRIRRAALSCLIAAGVAAATVSGPLTAHAHDTLPIPTGAYETIDHADDWCVWTESNTCNYQVDDDLTPNEFADRDLEPSEPRTHLSSHSSHAVSRTASNFESSLAAVAASACAKAGISVEQLIEPFAMVSTHEENSVDQIVELQQWWSTTQQHVEAQYNSLIQLAETADDQSLQATAADTVAGNIIQGDVAVLDAVSLVPLVDLRSDLPFSNAMSPLLASVPASAEEGRINETNEPADFVRDHRDADLLPKLVADGASREQLAILAMEEPIDAQTDSLRMHGRSILVTQSNQSVSVSPAVPPTSQLVGSSAMIVSIEEVYMPYDLAARDVQWSLHFPLAKRPFCVRNRRELRGLPDETPAEVASDAEPAPEAINVAWTQAWAVIGNYASLPSKVQPAVFGSRLVDLVDQRKVLTQRAVQQIARVWPAAPPQPAVVRPSKVGAKLLARAKVVVDGNAEVEKKAQVSKQLPAGFDADETLAVWVDQAVRSSRSIQSALSRILATPPKLAQKPNLVPASLDDVAGETSRR